jgi:glutaredoxin
MILKMFTQPSCPRCPAAKAIVKQIEHKVKVENYDIKTVEGLTEALEYDVLSTPSIIVFNHDNEVLGEWRGEAPSLEDLNKILK